jgi:hypothetical protein
MFIFLAGGENNVLTMSESWNAVKFIDSDNKLESVRYYFHWQHISTLCANGIEVRTPHIVGVLFYIWEATQIDVGVWKLVLISVMCQEREKTENKYSVNKTQYFG